MSDKITLGGVPTPTTATLTRRDLANVLNLIVAASPSPADAKLRDVFCIIAHQLQAAGASEVKLSWSIPGQPAPESDAQ